MSNLTEQAFNEWIETEDKITKEYLLYEIYASENDRLKRCGNYHFKAGDANGYNRAIEEVREWVCSECEYNNGQCFEDSQMSGYCHQYDLLSKLSKMREGK